MRKLIDRASLEKLAGPTIFQRGNTYFLDDAVSVRQVTEQKISARVHGTETYRVELWDDDGGLNYDCTCPHAAEGHFCKHCVAAGLAWLAGQPASTAVKDQPPKPDPWMLIRDHLQAQAPGALIELLLSAADYDDRLYQSLLRKAELATGKTDLAKTFRKLINDATHTNGFIDWDEAGDYAAGLAELVESLQELLNPEQAGSLVELTEYAIERVEEAIEQIDDSNGEVGGIVETLNELHFKACELAKPEPSALAERLFHLEMTLSMGIASFDPLVYQPVLGQTGLQRYRELAEVEWASLKPNQLQDGYNGHRYTLTRIMESLAKASGNVEELVAIKARDLSSAYRYLDIAQIWEQAGQDNKALEWAERGLQAFPNNTDNRLRDFLVTAYLARKRPDEALQLTWVQFDERPTLEHYKKLYCVAEPLGVWPAQRERALVKVAEAIATHATSSNRWHPQSATPNYSLRVAIALWENDLDAAWIAAHAGVCDQQLLIILAGQLTVTRPEDAVSLYQRVVSLIVEQTNNRAYEEAMQLICKIEQILLPRQEGQVFQAYINELRLRYKPKRNFIKLLDGLAPRRSPI